MLNVTYEIVKEIYRFGQSTRTSYGIVAYSCGDKEDTASIIASVHDITSDKNSLKELVSLCNRFQLSTIHLNEIVEDFFSVPNGL